MFLRSSALIFDLIFISVHPNCSFITGLFVIDNLISLISLVSIKHYYAGC